MVVTSISPHSREFIEEMPYLQLTLFYIFLLSLEVNHLSTRKLGSLSSDSHAWTQIIIQGCFGFRITEMEVDGKDRVGSHPQSRLS